MAALVANTNLDNEQNDRQAITAQTEEHFNTVIANIWNGTGGDTLSEEEQAAWDSPLLQAGRRAIANLQTTPVLPGQAAVESLPSE